MAQTTDLELNGVPVRAATPLPVALTSGGVAQGGAAFAAPANAAFARGKQASYVLAELQVSDQCQSATGAAAAAVTATLPTPGANLRQYITRIQIVQFASVATVGAAAPVLVTTTGIANTPTFDFPTALAIGTQWEVNIDFPAHPLEASADNATVTFVAPATTGIIWRINVWYYNA